MKLLMNEHHQKHDPEDLGGTLQKKDQKIFLNILMTKYLQEYDSEDLRESLQQKNQKLFWNILMAEHHKKYDSEYLGVDNDSLLQKRIKNMFEHFDDRIS